MEVGWLFAQLEIPTSRQEYWVESSFAEKTRNLVVVLCPAQKISSPVFCARWLPQASVPSAGLVNSMSILPPA